MNCKAIWITWERQRRNRELSKSFEAELFELDYISHINNIFRKYFIGIIHTLQILLKVKPTIIYCQNPSIVLSLFVVSVKFFFGYNVCIDSHYAGMYPFNNRYLLLNMLTKLIQKNADITIVTNENLAQQVKTNGGTPYILQDKTPNIPILVNKLKLFGEKNLLFICTFAEDEPYVNVLEAAKKINPNIFIYVTGNYHGKSLDHHKLSKNVVLMGYISEEKYQMMLNSVDVVIDLTTREDCLVCGGYESVAVGKPMILSDTCASRECFYLGAVYTNNTIESIAESIVEALSCQKELCEQIKKLKIDREKQWNIRKDVLLHNIF